MITKKDVLMEYENILLGKKVNYSSSILSKLNSHHSQKHAVFILKYCFESLLGWKPNDIANMLTKPIISQMKLETPLRFISTPGDVSMDVQRKYIAHFLYPNRYLFREKELTLSIFKDIIDDKLYSFPKRFFDDAKGEERALICLHYIISNRMQFESLEALYKAFYSGEGAQLLKTYQLSTAAAELFDTPVDYVHFSIPESQRNDFLREFYKVQQLYAREKRARRIQATKDAKELERQRMELEE